MIEALAYNIGKVLDILCQAHPLLETTAEAK